MPLFAFTVAAASSLSQASRNGLLACIHSQIDSAETRYQLLREAVEGERDSKTAQIYNQLPKYSAQQRVSKISKPWSTWDGVAGSAADA
jgi:hypothetical protein